MTLVEVRDLEKQFAVRRGLFGGSGRGAIHAVDRVSFTIAARESLGLVGESGSGKSVTGELLLRLQAISGGQVLFQGREVSSLRGADLLHFRRNAQIIFQDPYETLNPQFTVARTLQEPLRIHGLWNDDGQARVTQSLDLVELQPAQRYLGRYAHELSGGERQRVAIARALILGPTFVVADEPTSMLDVSVRAGVLNLFRSLRERLDLSLLFISHDLSTVRYLCDRTAVMYLGKIMEIGPTRDVIDQQSHPYTGALVSAIPRIDFSARRARITIPGGIPSALQVPSGCRFHPRCPDRLPVCSSVEPAPIQIGDGHYVACHLFSEVGHRPTPTSSPPVPTSVPQATVAPLH